MILTTLPRNVVTPAVRDSHTTGPDPNVAVVACSTPVDRVDTAKVENCDWLEMSWPPTVKELTEGEGVGTSRPLLEVART